MPAWLACSPRLSPIEVSSRSRVPACVRVCRDDPRQRDAIHPRHVHVQYHQVIVLLRLAASRSICSARGPSSAARCAFPSSQADARGCCGSWDCHRRPGHVSPTCSAGGRWGSASASPGTCFVKGAVKVKVLPLPGILIIPISPPINSLNLLAMESPNPVPPNRRDVEPSACANAENSRPSCSGPIPIPVSVTLEMDRRDVVGRPAHRTR